MADSRSGDTQLREALERLGVWTPPDPTERPRSEPQRAAYDVRSANTGAVVVRDVPERVAASEAARLNGEAREVIGRVPSDGDRALHLGEQRGEATTYEVVSYSVTDERAYAKQLRDEAKRIRASRSDAPADRRESLGEEAERLEERAAELDRAAAERDVVDRGAQDA